jgi:hypothetical protein
MKTNPTASSICVPAQVRRCKSQSKPFRWGVLVFFLSAIVGPAQSRAQTVGRIQVFGGYSYTRFDSSTFGFAGGSNLNGWNLAVSGNVIRNLGATAELSGQYGNHMNLRDFAVGPQVLFPHGKMLIFGHVLFGKGRTFVNEGGGVGDTQRAYLLGGGVDMPFHHHFDIRVIQADYVHTQLLGQNQNNYRVSAGVVYHWGEIRRTKHRPPSTQAP